jgi:hypothetical protein
MTEVDPKLTSAQQENIRRYAHSKVFGDSIEKDVVGSENAVRLVRSEDPTNPLLVTPTQKVVDIFRRVTESVYLDEILPDANPTVHRKIGWIDQAQERNRKRWKR